ncbi:MAG: hypothetical protein OM95_09625 [Bdellovibrio sp. ArHS]|uniref:hypothetical protein n=1 Tax=Bdellovibrio sp. ArHS TaxID=1569284 RepID=UPI000582688B|nr:hypothetical protein [Bdellovibrio sp. ArHS]KHD88446.1 MAG: hypothetical protein OM95_09625 [Bdellovibrio sp. ArHS]
MKKTLAVLFLLMAGNMAQAAPYYAGVGCNEEGTRCTFGKPSGRVLNWSKKGTIQELGERCEKFINNIEARKNEISKSQKVELKYKNFTYSWSNEIQEDGRAKIVCAVELHSELPEVKFETKSVKRFFWVCENKDSAGVCAHYFDECEAVRDEALRDGSVLDATIYRGGSLLQGNICDIVTVKFK